MTKSKSSEKQSQWIWNQNNKEYYLQSKLLLDKGFRHGFFCKNSWKKNPKELVLYIGKNSSIHSLNQVHGNNIIGASSVINEAKAKGDCLYSDRSNQSLWIYSADCIPILFADIKKGNVASCHSGWRGIENKIVIKTINNFIQTGSRKENIAIALGPAISGRNYDVRIDVIESIYQSIFSHKKESSNNGKIIDYMIDLGIINRKIDSNEFKLSIREAAISQMLNCEIDKNKISKTSLCTFEEDSIFHSWRRDQIKAFQWSGIISN